MKVRHSRKSPKPSFDIRKEESVRRAVRLCVSCTVGRGVGPGLNDEEVLVQVSLVAQVKTFLADVESGILQSVDGGLLGLYFTVSLSTPHS